MKNYVGVKLIQAEPMSKEGAPGYRVVYPDGYESWSPKDVFEKAYMVVGDDNKITQEVVDAFIVKADTVTYGEKTTVVHVTLANGFVLTEASSCVDPANYSKTLGTSIALRKIKDQIWGHLGFVLQCGVGGMK